MNPEKERFLNLREQPQRITVEEAADKIGCSPHEIPRLVAKGLLKPLGHPAPNAPKYFLRTAIDDLARDVKWHNKASDVLQDYWRYKNGRKTNHSGTSPQSRLQGE